MVSKEELLGRQLFYLNMSWGIDDAFLAVNPEGTEWRRLAENSSKIRDLVDEALQKVLRKLIGRSESQVKDS